MSTTQDELYAEKEQDLRDMIEDAGVKVLLDGVERDALQSPPNAMNVLDTGGMSAQFDLIVKVIRSDLGTYRPTPATLVVYEGRVMRVVRISDSKRYPAIVLYLNQKGREDYGE